VTIFIYIFHKGIIHKYFGEYVTVLFWAKVHLYSADIICETMLPLCAFNFESKTPKSHNAVITHPIIFLIMNIVMYVLL